MASKKETTTADIAPFYHKLAFTARDDEEELETEEEELEEDKFNRILKKFLSEEVRTSSIAGTDTRFGGPSFEPNYFEDEVDALENEVEFHDDPAVIPPGWEYVDTEKYDYEKVKANISAEIDDELDFEHRYQQLLKRLKKIHNI